MSYRNNTLEISAAGRSPRVATSLSIFPGLGQIYNSEPRKGLLFMLVGATNFAVLLFIALSTQFLHLMKTFGQELNIRPNHQLMEALSTVQFGSAVSNLLIFLFLCFTAFSMRDAFDRALLVRKRAIYATDAMQMSEASSGSYLFHIALMLTTLILSFFFLIPPAPREQVTEIEFVQPDEKTHEKIKSKKHSTENSRSQRDPNVRRTSIDAQKSSAANRPQTSTPRRPEPQRPQERRVTTRQEEPKPRQQQSASTTPVPAQAQTPAPASQAQTPTPPRPVPIQRAGGSMIPAPPTVQPPTAVSHIAPTPQPQSRMPVLPTIPNLSSLVPMSANSGKTATAAPGPQAVKLGQSPPRGPMISDKSGQLNSVQPGIEEMNTQQNRGTTRGPIALKGPAGGDSIGDRIAPPAPSNNGSRRGTNSVGPIGKPDLPAVSGTSSPGPNSATGGKNQTSANPENGLRKGAPSDDVVKEVDFSRFMAELQRKVKQAWFPPKDTESLRIKVQFVAHKNGTMSNLRLIKSSGNALADQAALRAVQNAAPFRPLPEGAPPSVDIEFTFDYNVFRGGGGGSRLRNW